MVPLAPYRLAVMVTALMLAACSSSPPVERDRYYSLAPQIQESPSARPSSAILLVNALSARGFLGGRQIVYRTKEQPLLVERYDTLLWEEPVPQGLSQILVNAVRDAGVFRFVVIPADRASADYMLGGEVERFEHHPTDQPPSVVARLNLSLVNARDRKSLWTRSYQGEEPVAAATPQAMAEAFDRLTGRLVGEVVRDLKGVQPRLHGGASG